MATAMSDDPENSIAGDDLLTNMLQQDPYLRDAEVPTATKDDGRTATMELTLTAEDPASLKQSQLDSSERRVAEHEEDRAANLAQRPQKALPKTGPAVKLSRDMSGTGNGGRPAAGSATTTPSGTPHATTSAAESRTLRQGGGRPQDDQQAAAVRKSKRKAAEEPEPEPEEEGSSEGRQLIPKRPKLRPPTSSQTHPQSPSIPSGSTTTARAVLEMGFNSAKSLFKNLGSTTGLSGSTTTPLNSPPTKGSGSSTVLITPPPTNARPQPSSRMTQMLAIEPQGHSSGVPAANPESQTIPGSLALGSSQQSLQLRSQLSEAGPTSDEAGPSVADRHERQPPPDPHRDSSESSRQSRSVTPELESKVSTPRPTRAEKGKDRVPNSPPRGVPGGTGGVPNDPIAQLHAELRLLGTSVRGLGTAMVSLVDQNKTFMASMGTYTEKIDQLISGGGVNAGRPRRAAPKAKDADTMEVDEEGNGDDADDESDALPVKLPRRKKPFKLTSLPMRRPVEENALKAAIRQMTLDYMGRKNNKSLFDLNKLPLEEDLEAFEAAEEDDGPCCTIDDFRPDLNGTPRSKWNASVAEVFVAAYMTEGSIECDDSALVKKFFVRHLKYLIDKFKERHTDREVLNARAKAKRRRERRTYLFNRRLIAANSEPDLQRHVYILQRLGREGMSSDESDFSNGVKQFRILKKVWRDPKLTPWLRVFDSIAREKRINPITETTRGADPRQRFESSKYDNRSPPVGQLPWNAYNEVWYKHLTAYAKKRLEARKKAYDFSHTAQIEVQASQANGSHVEGRAPRFR